MSVSQVIQYAAFVATVYRATVCFIVVDEIIPGNSEKSRELFADWIGEAMGEEAKTLFLGWTKIHDGKVFWANP